MYVPLENLKHIELHNTFSKVYICKRRNELSYVVNRISAVQRGAMLRCGAYDGEASRPQIAVESHPHGGRTGTEEGKFEKKKKKKGRGKPSIAFPLLPAVFLPTTPNSACVEISATPTSI